MPTNTAWHMKQNDLLKVLTLKLKNADGSRLDCSTVSTTVFSMWSWPQRVAKVTRQTATLTLTTDLDSNGDAFYEASYSWQSGDTDTPGQYSGEFELTFPGGPLTVPTSYTPIWITDDIA